MSRIPTVIATVLLLAPAVRADDAQELQQLKAEVKRLRQKVTKLEAAVKALEPLRKRYEQEQRDIREQKELGGLPGPIETTGKKLPANRKLKPGDVLQAAEAGIWYAARVVKPLRGGKVRIHFIGWPSSYDTDLPRSQLQLDPNALEKARKAANQLGIIGSWKFSRSIRSGVVTLQSVPSTGIPVANTTKLKVGQRLQVESSGAWWAGKVLELRPKGNVKIRYVGWGKQFDEVVPRSRLQLLKK